MIFINLFIILTGMSVYALNSNAATLVRLTPLLKF